MSDSPQSPYDQQPETPQYPDAANPQAPYSQAPYSQPPYSQAPYPQAGYPQAGYRVPASGGSTLGRTALIIAVIVAVLNLVFQVALPQLAPEWLRYGLAYGALFLGRGFASVVLGGLALILGIIAARNRSQPVLAGIAIGVGAVEVMSSLLGVVVNALYSLA